MRVQVPSLRQRNAHARALEALLIGALPEQGTAIVSTPLPGSKGFVSGGKFSLQTHGKNARFVNAKCLIQKNYALTISLLCCLSGF
jgi:hypothetical protein